MEREGIKQLYAWKANPRHKPLIIRGARQVGKTWLMRAFAEAAYEHVIYINFEDNERLRNVFERDYDIDRILNTISIEANQDISPHTVLLFDEIQAAPRGLTSLKYFYEKAPEQDIIAAGSLLGISASTNASFPVGKVDFANLYPLSFTEFLNALGQQRLATAIAQRRWDLLGVFHDKLTEYLRTYYYVGGMPEVVQAYVEQKNYAEVRRLQNAILDTYDRDFSKHAPISEVPRIRMVWNSIRSQLSKENKKFIYGALRAGARAKDFEVAIEWLRDAGLICQVHRTKKGLLPLAAYEDQAFKLFLMDVGLLTAMNKLPASVLIDGNALFTDAKGGLTEQFVHQQLQTLANVDIFYWSAENSSGEIDFLIQSGERVIPIEVKAEENLQSKSLRAFVAANPLLHGIRLSMSPYREQDWMTNIPLYAACTII